jgi:protoporphyrinogen IX oxidase
MADFMSSYYLWIKAFHILSVIAWMAGLLYLPRLYVYHCEAAPGSQMSETFKVMERRLMRGIINPSMIFSILFGGMMLSMPGLVDWSAGWMWVKLAMIAGLIAVHIMLSRWRRAFAEDRNNHPAKLFRIVNEVPALLLVVIVVCVVVKPF